VNTDLRPLLSFITSAKAKETEVAFAPQFITAPLVPVNYGSSLRTYSLSYFYKRVDRLRVFTKQGNLNKLYVDNNGGLLLTAGIVLRFLNLDQSKFLKKRLRT
jgi:hypothetical protein